MAQTVCARCMTALTGQDKRVGKILCSKCEAVWERNVSLRTVSYDPSAPSAFSGRRAATSNKNSKPETELLAV